MVAQYVARIVAGTLLVTIVVGCTEQTATQQTAPSPSSTPRANVQTAPPSASSTPANAQGVAADAAYAQDERDLVRSATLILVGAPTDEKVELSRSSDGGIINYGQIIRVEQVLKGHTPGSTVQIVRSDFANPTQASGWAVADEAFGLLAPGPHLLFLEPSAAADVFQIVGHASGDMPLDAGGRTTNVRPEVKGFANLDLSGVQNLIAQLSVSEN